MCHGAGLTVSTQAVIGDIGPPRDRGRNAGLTGLAFAVLAAVLRVPVIHRRQIHDPYVAAYVESLQRCSSPARVSR